MRKWVLGAIVTLSTTLATAALACPMGGDGVRPTPRPIQTVSFQASELLERAGRLDAVAATHEQAARGFAERAETFTNRARLLRNQALLVNASDRPDVLSIADELLVRASESRDDASRERSEASELRSEARALRGRATQLRQVSNGGGGGWKGGPRRSVPSTPLPSERTVNL